MEYILEFFQSILKGEVDRRKVLMAVFMIVVGIALLLVYENLTASFTLSRLQKSADLVSKLQEIGSAIKTSTNPELLADYKTIEKQVAQTLNQTPLPIEISTFLAEAAGKDFVPKFFFGSAVFWLLGMIAIFLHLLKTSPTQVAVGFWNLAKATVQISSVYGFFAIWIPKVYWPFHWWPFFHICIYPIFFTVAIGLFASLFINPKSDLAPIKTTK